MINFFFIYPNQMNKLQKTMAEDCERHFEFVKSCDTRWFSHYKMVLVLFKARKYLEKYKNLLNDDDEILNVQIASKSLDTIGSKSFWSKLGLIAEVLRIVTIEIGNTEKRTATLSDVIESFGRIWAYLHNINVYKSSRFSSLPGFLNDMLTRWEWRLNIYYDIDLLILAHVFNPGLGMRGLKSPEFNRRKVYNILQTVAQKFDPSIAENISRKTTLRREFVEYLQLISDANFTSPKNPFIYWSCQSDLDFDSNSDLKKIALRILSAPASAADLERIWSACLLTLTPNRRNMQKKNVLKTIQIKSSLSYEHEESRIKHQGDILEKSKMKSKISDLLDTPVTQTQMSQNEPSKLSEGTVDISDTSSDDTVQDCDSGMGKVLDEIDVALSTENIAGLARDRLDDKGELTQTEGDVLDDSEVQRYLDDVEEDAQPPKKKRKMPGYKKVTQKLSTLFDFDVYNDKSKLFYSNDA